MTPLRRDRPGPFIGRARHHDSVVALQPDLLVELMAPLRRDRPGPLIGRARHPLRTRRRMQASNKPKSMGAHTVAYHAHIFVGGPLQYMGIWAFRARECRYSHPIPGRAAHSRALARALIKAQYGQHARLHERVIYKGI